MHTQRLDDLRTRLADAGFDAGIFTDDDTVYYLAGFYDYLHMDFGRPTILVVTRSSDSILITPSIELEMAQAAAHVDKIVAWNDGLGAEWREALPDVLRGADRIGIEPLQMPPPVRGYLETLVGVEKLGDVTPITADMRMIKTPEELQMARHAGQVAMDMMQAGRETIADGVPEFEVALATAEAGTRKAAALLTAHYSDSCMSPNTYFLQIMASVQEIAKPHHRASTRIMRHGEPVFFMLLRYDKFSPLQTGL